MSTPELSHRSLCLIVNGKCRDDAELIRVIDLLKSQNRRIEVNFTKQAGDAFTLAKDRCQSNWDAIVAVGGDGTANEVAQGMLSAEDIQAAFALIPYGTANDFATACGIPANNPDVAIEMLDKAPRKAIDVGKVNDQHFINMVSCGYGAEITAETAPELKQLLGGFAYFVTGVTQAANIQPRTIHVTADDFQWSGEALAITVGNGRQSGGGYKLAPKAIIDDGLLDVTIVKDFPLMQYFEVLAELKEMTTHFESEHLIYLQTDRLSVEAPDGLQFNLDGEPGEDKHLEFELLPRRLPCYLPIRAPFQGL
ncbi:lipid kinase YegS [Thalassoroseus pseudoceratinae]|uniref:lipid kinase YegS n=1 Tax=Thalassoroseus pseudoceratinae TaxID=2713176 RepID=UPI0014239CB7|nr:lipid kinase YegS [Thalassoroseus pseudoceratinae]